MKTSNDRKEICAICGRLVPLKSFGNHVDTCILSARGNLWRSVRLTLANRDCALCGSALKPENRISHTVDCFFLNSTGAERSTPVFREQFTAGLRLAQSESSYHNHLFEAARLKRLKLRRRGNKPKNLQASDGPSDEVRNPPLVTIEATEAEDDGYLLLKSDEAESVSTEVRPSTANFGEGTSEPEGTQRTVIDTVVHHVELGGTVSAPSNEDPDGEPGNPSAIPTEVGGTVSAPSNEDPDGEPGNPAAIPTGVAFRHHADSLAGPLRVPGEAHDIEMGDLPIVWDEVQFQSVAAHFGVGDVRASDSPTFHRSAAAEFAIVMRPEIAGMQGQPFAIHSAIAADTLARAVSMLDRSLLARCRLRDICPLTTRKRLLLAFDPNLFLSADERQMYTSRRVPRTDVWILTQSDSHAKAKHFTMIASLMGIPQSLYDVIVRTQKTPKT